MSKLVWHRGEFDIDNWGSVRTVTGWISGAWGIRKLDDGGYCVTLLAMGWSCNPRLGGFQVEAMGLAQAKRWVQALEDNGFSAIKCERDAKKFKAVFKTLVERRAWQETPLT